MKASIGVLPERLGVGAINVVEGLVGELEALGVMLVEQMARNHPRDPTGTSGKRCHRETQTTVELHWQCTMGIIVEAR